MILLNYTPYYIAERTNACLPSFSTIDFTDDSFTIKTYDYNGNRYADDFTITKKGISTLLDKTIYSQVAEGQQAQSDDYTADKAPFIAATITVVMIIYAYSYQMHQILNMHSIAIEIMRGIAGTIGIILTVPITSLIMSMLLTREKKAAPEKKQKCECK